MLVSLKKALLLVPQLSPKLVMIGTTCRVVGYASGKNEQLFLQAIDKGMYKMEKMGLSQDDDDKLGFSGDENDGDDSVVVVDSDADSLINGMKDDVIAAVPSREVCRHTGLPLPRLATCTSTSHSIQQC